MILTVIPSGEGHPAHHFLWSQDHGSTTPPSYGKTFKMFEPYGALGLKYHFETYSTSVSHDHIIIVHHQKGPNVVDDSSSGRIFCILSIATICQPLPSHRLIIEPCLRCDARCPHNLSAPACGLEIKPKAYRSQRCLPPAKAWWRHLVTLDLALFAQGLDACSSLSSLTLELFETIAFFET